MYVVFLKYILVENFNTSTRSHQPIPWNCNDKNLGADDRGLTYGAEGRGPRKTNTLIHKLKNLINKQNFFYNPANTLRTPVKISCVNCYVFSFRLVQSANNEFMLKRTLLVLTDQANVHHRKN